MAETNDTTEAPAKSEEQAKTADSLKADPPNEADASSPEASPADPLADARAEAAKMKEQWIRTAADFDNFRKRVRRELEDNRKAGREELLKDLLPVFDNLERAIQSAQRAQDVKALAEGLQMVLRQFTDTLGRSGIQKVPTMGKEFDPSVHEAIQQVETDEHAAGTIVAEVQPGYLQGDRLVRAAMVVVAKPKPKEDEGDGKKADATESNGKE
jgi:molecular chaperone GrpE